MKRKDIFNGQKPNFRAIPSYVECPTQGCDYSWESLFGNLESMKIYTEENKLDMNPDFQRGHVWDEEQQIAYVEYCLSGGVSGKEIYMNSPEWHSGGTRDLVLVDGKQRLEAARKFIVNELKAFGYFYKEFDGKLDMFKARFRFNVNSLQSREEVLRWYLEMNTGGTPHSQDEISRVSELLNEEMNK